MAIATQKKMTLEEYLAYTDGTDYRYELVDGVLVEMGQRIHSIPRSRCGWCLRWRG